MAALYAINAPFSKILLDIAAPICLLFGLNATTAANASLLNNFEIVATAVIAAFLSLLIFREMPGATYFAAVILMAAGVWLSSRDEFRKRRKPAGRRRIE